MGGVAGGRLAAAVSAAGGLGMIGMGSSGSTAALRAQLDAHRAAPGFDAALPFGIGVVDWKIREHPDLLDLAVDTRPTLLSVSFGDRFDWVDRARDAGIRTATQVYAPEQARVAGDAGVDVLVARGADGGGHGDPTGALLPLLDAVLEVVDLPVLAAGGVASPRSLAAVLAAGAAGAWIGTALSATVESLAPAEAKDTLVAARADETVLTRAYDVIEGWPWPARFLNRVVRNGFTDRWTDGVDALEADDALRADAAAAAPPAVDAGVGVGRIDSVEPVAAILARLGVGAMQLLRDASPDR
nr:nitronate monooxygenase [Gordonia soli]